MRWALVLCAALGLCAQSAVAREAVNCTVALRATVPLFQRGLVFVSAKINGAPATLVLDTGADRSIITREAAARLKVTDRYDFARPINGIARTIASGDARLGSLTLNGFSLPYPRILVGPVSLGSQGGVEPDGLLGADLLGDFDVELDVPHRQLRLYDRLECETLRPPWPGPYTTIQTTRGLGRHPFFPIQVDGHALSAVLDSGATRSFVAAQAAARVGVGPAALARDPSSKTRGAGGEEVAVSLHRFRQFTVAGDALAGPVLVASIALPRDVDAILGLDYLAARRVYLSYGSRRIFIAHE
ncbi:MAG TPA: retroviral-like aspartic protease family protein [Acetobacteraceae bacterium]|nr:retroviral-like aspartic protease family protein [Acetobacteraceae bacterium]